jgi:hypothetical protein
VRALSRRRSNCRSASAGECAWADERARSGPSQNSTRRRRLGTRIAGEPTNIRTSRRTPRRRARGDWCSAGCTVATDGPTDARARRRRPGSAWRASFGTENCGAIRVWATCAVVSPSLNKPASLSLPSPVWRRSIQADNLNGREGALLVCRHGGHECYPRTVEFAGTLGVRGVRASRVPLWDPKPEALFGWPLGSLNGDARLTMSQARIGR